MFKGSMTAMITPFQNGGIDENALRRLTDFQIQQGIYGLVPCGTTGEAATLSHEEHNRVIDIVVDEAAGRVPVIAGTGSNSTEEAIELTRHAKDAGAQAALLITPYYNRPSQEGLYRHFAAVAGAVELPLILYNVPSRTGVNLMPETVARLSRIENIVGLKDAAGNIKQTLDTLDACEGNLDIFTGDDFGYLSLLAVGGRGGICVLSNLVPGQMAELYNAWARGDSAEAARLQLKLHPLNHCMYLETNPIPVKWAAHRMGLCGEEIRLPLTPLAEKFRPELEAEMKKLELI